MKPKASPPSEINDKDNPQALIKSLEEKRSFFVAEEGSPSFYPQYFEQFLSQDLQKFYLKNGHRSLVKSLRIQVVSELDDCRDLWEEFSPKKTVFDTWDFRLAFWQGYRDQPYFLLLKNQTENLALLPLWYEREKRSYFWFGSWWQEENSFWVKNPILVPLLLAASPKPVHLNAISLETVLWTREFVEFAADDPKYILDLTRLNSADDFLATLKKKKRYNLKRDRRLIEAQRPQIIIDNFSHFNALVALSLKRFHEKGEDADWEDPCRVETFRQVIKLGQIGDDYRVRMISIKIGGRIAGVDLIALFKGCYSPLKCGYDIENFPGIGNFVNLLEIDDAVGLGMKKIDFLEIGYGWKERWFEEIPLFKYDQK
jgi:hypothetical protein